MIYRDLEEAIAWLNSAFGFREHFRYGTPISGVQMHLGNAWIMLHGPRQGTAQFRAGRSENGHSTLALAPVANKNQEFQSDAFGYSCAL